MIGYFPRGDILKIWGRQKRVDFYIAAVIIPSIILAVVALWGLVRQYNFINYQLGLTGSKALVENEMFSAFSRVSIFAFSMIIVALLLILIIGSYLSAQDMQRQLEVVKLKNDFVSTVSHELKTPLTSVRLLAERLVKLSPKNYAVQKEYHSLILGQSYRLSYLIANILDFSKVEHEGKEKYRFEKADLREICREVIASYPTELLYPTCKLEVEIAANLPLFYLDKQAVSRAFVNLLDNALKFSPSGGTVRIAAGINGREAFVEVADQGPGVENKERIFERFYHTGKGTGLGLTLVRHIAEGHRGRVELESEKGKGSIFRLVLPLRKQS
jgi:signal transduction histidine kinase